MNLHLYVYNNYYNRTIKSFGSLEDINEFEVFVEQNTNFNPNDGIATEHIIGGPLMYDGGADYCVVEQDGDIISRWFVLENQRTRGGQYRIVMKRDCVADYANEVFNAPCFVEKGWVNDTDSAIFNKEDMTFNQIKKDEVLLKDTTNVPWLVGYYTKTNEALSVAVPEISRTADTTVNGIENWTYYDIVNNPKSTVSSVGLTLNFKSSATAEFVHIDYKSINSNSISSPIVSTTGGVGDTQPVYTFKTTSGGFLGMDTIVDKTTVGDLTDKLEANTDLIYDYWDDYFPSYISKTEFNALQDIIGNTIFDNASGKTYKVKGTVSLKSAPSNINTVKKVEITSSLGYELYDIYANVSGITGSRPTKNNASYADIVISIGYIGTIQFELEELDYKAVSVSIKPIASGQTLNSPYNIFAIPFGNFQVLEGENSIFTNGALAIRVAMALIEQYSGASGVLHDVQLLPYCPLQEIRNNMEPVGVSNKTQLNLGAIPEYLYSRITSESDTIGYVFNCTSTSAQFSIERIINIEDYKIENETEFCRLVSPNWNGMFEFSPAKNRGVEAFTVDMELKPFSPYIHVAPKWNEDGLYGVRDNDPIGLICGGDFGLTMISDAWATYERQNKNYQTIFDRQIQNLEVQNKYGRLADVVGGLTGIASAGAIGAGIGSSTGLGAGLGAGIGAGLSAVGAVGDLYINEQLRQENIDYTKDQFGYQLGNIRALPDSLTKVNSFNPNNTIFPILEFYGATDEEVEALRNKIKYNGMTIGRIGSLNHFINPAEETYIKGQIIKLDIPEDSHFVADIATEINKGVRI